MAHAVSSHNHGDRQAIRLRDRAAEFRRAKRHSTLVRVLKVALPLASAGIVSLYVLPAALTVSIDGGKGQASVESVSLEAGALKMVNPRVTGVHDKQGEYDVRAKSATQEASNPDILYLDTIDGRMTGPGGQETILTAPGAIYNNKIEEMTFDRGLRIVRAPGMSATFATATVHIPEQRVVSNTPVQVELHESTIRSDRLTLFTAEAKAIFEGRVKVRLARRSGDAASVSQSVDPARAANVGIQSRSEQPSSTPEQQPDAGAAGTSRP